MAASSLIRLIVAIIILIALALSTGVAWGSPAQATEASHVIDAGSALTEAGAQS